ncbi:MAG: portal protein [Nitrosotalea sp.]
MDDKSLVHQKLKKYIEDDQSYFKKNRDRFNMFRKFVFQTTLDDQQIAVYREQKKPQIEVNILESYINRLIGEFSKQEPSIEVSHAGEEQVDPQTIDLVQGNLKHTLDDANKNGFENEVYRDMLSGGFSVAKLGTKYTNPMSFNQTPYFEKVFDPVLCGFDPMSQMRHKGDGNWCYEAYPVLKADFMEEYPDYNIAKVKFNRKGIGQFNWSYKNQTQETMMVADFYEKKKKRTKIYKLSTGQSITQKNYKALIKFWDQEMIMAQPPQIIDERFTELDTIFSYKLIGDDLLDEKETDFTILPLVFFDGNSILLRDGTSGVIDFMTRPYVYQAYGMQRLKNFCAVSLANEIENIIQHKFKIAREALPNEEEYLNAYRDIQIADVLVYNHFDPNRPDAVLSPPMEVNRIPIPPELTNTFASSDQQISSMLGSFDMELGRMSKKDLSGIAMETAITQNNTAAMPYIIGFLQGLGQLARGYVDLLPKYIVTPQTMPVIGIDGKRAYKKVNQDDGIPIVYSDHSLNVNIKPGVNFAIQKQRNFETIIQLQQASPPFAEFMATEGMMFLLKNVEMQGIDELMQSAETWQKQMKEMKQQQMEQMKNQPNPEMLKMQLAQQKITSEEKRDQMDFAAKKEELQIKHADAILRHDATIKKTEAEVDRAHMQLEVARENMHHKHGLEVSKHAHESHDQAHRHIKEKLELHHMMKEKKDTNNE